MKRFVLLSFYVGLLCLLPSVYGAQANPGMLILEQSAFAGGLIVHLGCGSGEVTASLCADEDTIVHGLDQSESAVEQARTRMAFLGLSGKVSISRLYGDTLPFVDNVVNLVVVEPGMGISRSEMLRVLSPGSTAYIKEGNQDIVLVKPPAPERDEWTHYLYDASNNAVSRDRLVGQPRHMQFRTELDWSRNHHKLASVSGVVTAKGRLFYVMDSGPGADMNVPARWWIVARDAYNGVFLWKRAIGSWTDHARGFRSGPAQLPRLLVAADSRVYVPLSVEKPLVALDAASGKILRTFAGTEGTEEILLLGQTLFVVTGRPFPTQALGLAGMKKPNAKHIFAFQVEDEKLLWHKEALDPAAFVTGTLAADEDTVYYRYGAGVVCLDRQSGKEIWTNPKVVAPVPVRNTPGKGKAQKTTPNSNTGTSTLVVQNKVVVLSDGRDVTALNAKDGEKLWTTKGKLGFKSPQDVFVIDNTVWLGIEFTQGYDLRSGKVIIQRDRLEDIQTAGHHHRCYRNKATERYIIAGYRGIEFLDLTGEDHGRNNWVRGLCQYGVMPANGLIYAPPHSCGCYMEAKLHGFWALSAQREPWDIEATNLLEKGPAYESIRNPKSEIQNSNDWPTLRHDGRRSGITAMNAPYAPKLQWFIKLGCDLTPPVASAGVVLVADTDSHMLYALDAETGTRCWSFPTGARIDSPPTVHENLVIFGSRDGWVTCLSVTSGSLVWRFRAGPADLRTVDRDRVESLWPVYGSVLVQDDKAYCAAGRNSFLDGGLYLYALDVRTGKVVHRRRIHSQSPEILDKGSIEKLQADYPEESISQNKVDYRSFVSADKSDAFSMTGALNDVISGDGSHVYLRHLTCTSDWQPAADRVPHLFSTSSFVDDNENHRSHMTIGLGDFSRTIYAYPWIPQRFGPKLNYPMGLILVYQGDTAWGIQRGSDYVYTLFQKDIPDYQQDDPEYKNDLIRTGGNWTWSVKPSLRPRAMVKAGDKLILGGMPKTNELDPYATFEGRQGGCLQVYSADDGECTHTLKLSAPVVWDGIACAYDKLYIACQDGSLVCLK